MPLDFSQLRLGGTPGEQKPKRNALTAGLSAGLDNLQELGYNAVAAGADFVGADGIRDAALDRAFLNQMEAQENGRPDLERIEDQDLGSALPFVGYQIAKQVPQIAGALGVGALTGGTGAVPMGLSRAAASLPTVVGGGGLQAGAGFAARRAALQAGQKFAGNLVGGLGVGTVMGAGSMYGESVEAGNPQAGLSLALSPLYGITEGIPTAVLGGTLAKGAFNGGLGTRMLKAAGVNALGGATSEVVQNEMEMRFNPNLTDEEKFSRRLNSAVVGGLAEGAIGSFGGIRRPEAPRQLVGRDSEPEPQPTGDYPLALRPDMLPAGVEPPLVEPTRMPTYATPTNLLLPAPVQQRTTQDFEGDPIVVTPGGTVARMSQLSGSQPDLFGGPDVFPGQDAVDEADVQADPTTENGALFDAYPEAMVRTEYGPLQIRAALRNANGGKLNAQLQRFIPEFSRAVEQGPEAVEALIAKYDNNRSTLSPDVFETAAQMALDFQSRITNAQAAGSVARNDMRPENNWRWDDTVGDFVADRSTYTNRTQAPGNATEMEMRQRNEQRVARNQQAEGQFQMAGAIADTDARVQGAEQQRAMGRRREVLDTALDGAKDPGNARNRFIRALRKAGIRDTMVKPEEQAVIERFFNATEAFVNQDPDVIPSSPNEMGDVVAERTAPQQKKGKPARTNENRSFQLTPPPSTDADLAALEKAEAKRARKAGTPAPEPEDTRVTKQGELFTKKGQPTAKADQDRPAPKPRKAKVKVEVAGKEETIEVDNAEEKLASIERDIDKYEAFIKCLKAK